MDKKQLVKEMTFEEKAELLSGHGKMSTYEIERLGIKPIRMADGPHGTRLEPEDNCTHFPNLCNLGSSWDTEIAREMGRAIGMDCVKHGVDVLLGPGINIKRHILGGRNFEYLAEDPVLSGELAAAYIEGLQEMGVSACVKHFAVNNHETFRYNQSVEIDERVMRELYLKAFEIVVKKSKPDSVMSAYNKVNAVYCSENTHLLDDILRKEWGFDGLVLSDWGAVHDAAKAVKAGNDLTMPFRRNIVEELKAGLDEGVLTMDDIDTAVERMLDFIDRKPRPEIKYDRDKQHAIARKIAGEGMVLLKNKDEVLPITPDKYKKVAVIGEFAVKPIIGGQGSAEIAYNEEYTDSPFEEMKKAMPDVEFVYYEAYKMGEYSPTSLWVEMPKYDEVIKDCDLVVCFAGSMLSEDTEHLDRRTAVMNYNYGMFIEHAKEEGKPVALVLQTGSAIFFDHRVEEADSVVEMWISGEAAGGGIADVLSGKVNPCGKLNETFPKSMRYDLDYPGNGRFVEYKERFDVGYRYYDKHPEEVLFPFGYGLSYTSFEYSDLAVNEESLTVEFTLKNTGKYDGAEVVQLYIGDPIATVVKPIKELKQFKKIFLKAGEETRVIFKLSENDLTYFNASLEKWVAERGKYDVYIAASAQDIRLKGRFNYECSMPYTMEAIGDAMIG